MMYRRFWRSFVSDLHFYIRICILVFTSKHLHCTVGIGDRLLVESRNLGRGAESRGGLFNGRRRRRRLRRRRRVDFLKELAFAARPESQIAPGALRARI